MCMCECSISTHPLKFVIQTPLKFPTPAHGSISFLVFIDILANLSARVALTRCHTAPHIKKLTDIRGSISLEIAAESPRRSLKMSPVLLEHHGRNISAPL